MFRLERDMVGIARSWLIKQGLMVREEFSTPWGICDLVGVSLNQHRVQQRLGLGQKQCIGPLLRVDILNRIPDVRTRRSVTPTRLEGEYQQLLTPNELRGELEYLIASKFVRVTRRDTLQRLNGWAPLHMRIVALELKLNRVEEALGQAMSHLAFAEESFVGLPVVLAERIADSKRARHFVSARIGLLSIGADRCAVLVRPAPRKQAVNFVIQMHCIERFWRARFKGN